MSQANLAEALNKVGVPWKRATVVNLEARAAGSRGRSPSGRDSVSVGELLGLAEVLGVPPVALAPELDSAQPSDLLLQIGRMTQAERVNLISMLSFRTHPVNP